MNTKYDPIYDTSALLRFYEFFRGIGNAIMQYVELILKAFGWKSNDDEEVTD